MIYGGSANRENRRLSSLALSLLHTREFHYRCVFLFGIYSSIIIAMYDRRV